MRITIKKCPKKPPKYAMGGPIPTPIDNTKVVKNLDPFSEFENILEKNTYGYATKKIGVDPVLDSIMVENGAPSIDTTPLNRAYYTARNNTIHIGNNKYISQGDNILAELSHSKQFKPLLTTRRDSSSATEADKRKTLDLLTKIDAQIRLEKDNLHYVPGSNYDSVGDSLSYVTPGTLEHDAHSVIQPKIIQEYKDRYGRYASADFEKSLLEFKMRNITPSPALIPNSAFINNNHLKINDKVVSSKPRRLEQGGPIDPKSLEGDIIAKILLNRNQSLNTVQRLVRPNNYPELVNNDGSISTHLMEYFHDGPNAQAYMSPTLFYDNEGVPALTRIPNTGEEIIRVPNNYVEYISSQGYKRAVPDLKQSIPDTESTLTDAMKIKIKSSPRKMALGGTIGDPRVITDGIDKIYDYKVENGFLYAKRKDGGDWMDLQKLLPDNKYNQAVATIQKQYPDILDKEQFDVPAITAPSLGSSPVVSSINPAQPTLPTDIKPIVSTKDYGSPMDPTTGRPLGEQGDAVDALSMLSGELDSLSTDNESNYAAALKEKEDIFRRKNRLNVGSTIVNSLKGVQDTYVEPAVANTSLIPAQFRRTPVSIVEQQAAQLRSQVAAAGREMLAAGAKPSDVSAYLAQLQGRATDAESQLRFNFYNNNENLDRGRAAATRAAIDSNTAARVAAEEKVRTNQNQLLSQGVSNIDNLLKNRDKLITDEFTYGRGATSEYFKNKMDILQNKLNLSSNKQISEMSKEDMARQLKYLQEALKKNTIK